jgi:hypothetical protein
MRTIVGFLVFVLLLPGCASFDKRINTIQAGDSKEKVIEILGDPEDRQFKGKDEALQYCKTGTGFGMCGYRTIWFYDGRVTGITSYSMKCVGPGSCGAHFKTIKWEDAPDHTIEIRQR